MPQNISPSTTNIGAPNTPLAMARSVTLVCLVAVFDEPRKAIIAAVYYIVYQQIENYVVMPRLMRHTVSLPCQAPS